MLVDGYKPNEKRRRFLTAQIKDYGRCTHALINREAEQAGEELYWYNTVQERSEMFGVEVQCVSADVEDFDYEEGPYMFYEHYKSGVQCKDNMSEEIPKSLVLHGYWEDL